MGKLNEVSAEHPWKMPKPKLVVVDGIVIEAKDVH